MNVTKLLERAGALETIAYLSEHKEVTKTELIREIPVCQQSVCRTVDELVQAGFVNVRKENGFPGRKFHTLTTEGSELARTPVRSLRGIVRKR